jgi:hypothetical protein
MPLADEQPVASGDDQYWDDEELRESELTGLIFTGENDAKA